MDLTVSNQSGGNKNNYNVVRDYRKGNWTLQETMVLIEAKKMDDERRMKRTGDGTERGKPAELRWKWVEDYCWKNGCLRSQNQCNDKWDNLMRDFKKVREYENKVAAEDKSYWRIEKNERKDNHLPSNMLIQIYEALVEVVERKGAQRPPPPPPAGGAGAGAGTSNAVVEKSAAPPPPDHIILGHHHHYPPQQPILQAPAPAELLPLPPPVQSPADPPNLPFSQQLPSVDSDSSSDYSESLQAKRRKKGGGGGGSGEGTSGGGGGGGIEEVGTAISKSGAMIADAIQSCEEREERRHREMLRLHERRLHIEESKAEINRQGINGLVESINKLANSILALASHKNQPSK
ncbi:hypothetical protein ACJIZ3_013449 [Penstemon smallii]|uniref:Myb-like domain-containing protein n=1 Tax=Penstemon smallii TaxID=265156 RepID=A0ABD3UPW0_9LAMI